MRKTPQIVPAILSHDVEDFQYKTRAVEGIVERVQVDIMDGKFVANSTLQVEDIAKVPVNVQLEIQLMVEEPRQYLAALAGAHANLVEMHVESTEDLKSSIMEARSLGLQVGIALNPETPLESAVPFFSSVNLVLLMSVHPGFGGQEFISQTLERIRDLRKLGFRGIIEVDGGIKQEHLRPLIHVGADYLVVGSGIWDTPYPRATLLKFQQALQLRSRV